MSCCQASGSAIGLFGGMALMAVGAICTSLVVDDASELDRLYPPLTLSHAVDATDVAETASGDDYLDTNRTVSAQQAYTTADDSGQIRGLSDIPDDWPKLPANASLSAELSWVQANRLIVVQERPGQATLVHLDRAHSPAPSWAALGWLETSIRSYAKFVDVAAKATSTGDGEAEVWRHERRAIAEVEAIINEMMEDESTGN